MHTDARACILRFKYPRNFDDRGLNSNKYFVQKIVFIKTPDRSVINISIIYLNPYGEMNFCFQKFQKNGFVVLEGFFQPEEVDELKFCGEEFTKNLPPENERSIFSTMDLQQVKIH